MAVHILLLLLLGVTLALDLQHRHHLENRWAESNDHHYFFKTPRNLFVSDNAQDLEEKGKTRDWHQHTITEFSPTIRGSDGGVRGPSPSASSLVTVQMGHEGGRHNTRQNVESDKILQHEISKGYIYPHNNPVKMARFVADPALMHLIEKVDEAELQRLNEPTTVSPEKGERGTEASTVETITVHYEATKVPILSYLWNEFINLGDLLGREVLDTVSSRISFLWRSLQRFFKSRRRRAFPDTSHKK